MPQMQPLHPCARCEQELPEAAFPTPDALFCKRCTREVNALLRQKYSVIEAAHFRAQLRRSTRGMRRQSASSAPAAAGD